MQLHVTREVVGSADSYVTALMRACQVIDSGCHVCSGSGGTANDHGRKLVADVVQMMVGVSVA